jgi:hypothetical protein
MPNQFRTIYIPIKLIGEASGMVYLPNKNGSKN